MTSASGPPRSLLLVEDNAGDALVLGELLEDAAGRCNRVTYVGDLRAALKALSADLFDAVLLDLGLPDAVGAAGVVAIRAEYPQAPIVILSGLDDDEMAMHCLAVGAQDYVVKGSATIEGLRRAVAYAIARQNESRARRQADDLQARLAMIVETSRDAIVSFSRQGVIETWNAGAEMIFGYAASEAVGQRLETIIQTPTSDAAKIQAQRLEQALAGSDAPLADVVRLRRDGSEVVLSSTTRVLQRPGGETIGLAAVLRDVTEKRRQEDELKQRNEQLLLRDRQMRALAMRLNAVREDERIRLSREVHDELGQLLTGVKMDVRWVERHLDSPHVQLVERLGEMDGLLDRTITTVQRIATDLRPSALDALGLASALRDEARRFEERSGVAVAFRDDEDHRAPDLVGTAMFRIFQEILTNVARHAQASKLEVELTVTAESCDLVVRDNGTGFAPGVMRKEGLGLLGMRERAAECGGEVVIETEEGGGGTSVAVHIPLESRASNEASPDR